MSDNLNKNFFDGSVEMTTDHLRDDGKIEVRNKGTVQLLEDWLNKYFRTADRQPVERMLKAFRDVRSRRNKPSHTIMEDAFRPEIHAELRTLMMDAYGAVRVLRQLLANHPAARRIEVDDLLFEGKVWPF